MPATRATIYPEDALLGRDDLDVISVEQAPTLDAQFAERVRRSRDRVAYTDYDFAMKIWRDYTWGQIADEVSRWQIAMRNLGLRQGDHVALRLRNCRHWVIFDQAALGLGLVVVPLYMADRADNVNYVLDHARVKLLLVNTLADWDELSAAVGATPGLEKVVTLEESRIGDDFVSPIQRWLPALGDQLAGGLTRPQQLASIVYTSGTTGQPKGVMLSHGNIVANAYAGLRSVRAFPDDVLLSFLPLSHTLERTVGYYLSLMAGSRVAFARSIPHLKEDFLHIRPTQIITVPRILERVYSELTDRVDGGPAFQKTLFELTVSTGWKRFQWRQGRGPWSPSFFLWPLLDFAVASKVRRRLGGRLRLAVVGGAPLPLVVSRTLIPLGFDLLQGYGLTESSPSISINTLQQNNPASIGLPLHGVEVRIGENSELLARGPNVMMGYWKNDQATGEALADGWLHTGDQARIDDDGFIFIIGRIKEILVLANGEKVPPADMESAIEEDPLFEQSIVIGEKMPYLSAVVVLNRRVWKGVSCSHNIRPDDAGALAGKAVEQLLLERIKQRVSGFPGYARIRRVSATLEPWTVESGLLTPTLKLKRPRIRQRYNSEIELMYEGHDTFHDSDMARPPGDD